MGLEPGERYEAETLFGNQQCMVCRGHCRYRMRKKKRTKIDSGEHHYYDSGEEEE